MRAAREGASRAELRRRLRASRAPLNRLTNELSGILYLVRHSDAPATDLSWLHDPDDWPVMQTALAASADVLVTETSKDFPLGQQRNGVLFLSGDGYLTRLATRFPDAEA